MKSFFEEYGFVILAAIVVILLIAMASPIGDLVKAQITGIVDSFANKTESKLNAVDAGAITVRATTSGGSVTLTWDAEKTEDAFAVQYRASSTTSEKNWAFVKSDGTITDKKQSDTGFDGMISDNTKKTRTVVINKDSDGATGPIKNGTKVEYKVYDSNGAVVASGTVVARN